MNDIAPPSTDRVLQPPPGYEDFLDDNVIDTLPYDKLRSLAHQLRTRADANERTCKQMYVYARDMARMAQQRSDAMKQAQEASLAKSRFLATMSHEIRTPMNGVLGIADLLAGTALSPEQLKYVQAIRSSGKALIQILGDILDFSKIEAGKMELRKQPFKPAELIREATELFQGQALKKAIEIRYRIDGEPDTIALGDRLLIARALYNLVGNAVKFTDRGHVEISLHITPSDDDQVSLIARISDTGIGIAKEDLAQLFQPFSQADASSTRTKGGTGLGLVLTRNTIELMGGRVEVSSEAGHGSVFSISLTLPLVAVATASKPAKSSAVQAKELRGTVLLVEDNKVNQLVAITQLKRLGLQVRVAENGQQALDVFETGNVDLILMDCQMPVMDGYQATSAIRARESRHTRIPIVALTANAVSGDADLCFEIGMDAFLSKPFRPSELLRVLGRYLIRASEARISASQLSPLPWVTIGGLTQAGQPERLATFETQSRKILESLLAATTSHDLKGVGEQAHALSTACTVIGAPRLAAVSNEISQLADMGNIEDLSRATVELGAIHRATLRALAHPSPSHRLSITA